MSMWNDETDLTQLAQRLHVGPRELREAIGGPWLIVDRDPADEIARPGTLFIGRAGPSVAVLVGDEAVPDVTVGVATGEWPTPGQLVWSLVDPTRPVRSPAAHASDDEVRDFLDAVGHAVDDAFDAKRPTLVVCRYCGDLVAPEHALDDRTCHGCGSAVRGIVY
jgi:hypothetical protein